MRDVILRASHVLSHMRYLVLSAIGSYVPVVIIKPHFTGEDMVA